MFTNNENLKRLAWNEEQEHKKFEKRFFESINKTSNYIYSKTKRQKSTYIVTCSAIAEILETQ